MNYYPLFRVRSWKNGVRCMSIYILIQLSSEFQNSLCMWHNLLHDVFFIEIIISKTEDLLPKNGTINMFQIANKYVALKCVASVYYITA